MILKGYIFGILYALVCLVLSMVAYKLGMPKKYSRKFVHILVGFEWVILSHYCGPTIHFVAVCVIFLVLLSVSYFKNLMPMISSEADNAPGTVYYALAMTIVSFICLFVPDMMEPFGVGVFIMSLGDGFAGTVGQLIKKHNPKIFGNKSLFGTLANFVFSTGTALVFDAIFDMGLKVWHCFAIGVFAVVLELVTIFGLDNITLTLGSTFLTYALIKFPLTELFVIPLIFSPLVFAVVLKKKVLTKWGTALAFLLDVVVSVLLGNFGFVLLVVFLFGSVIIDKIKKRKKGTDDIGKKGDCRDAIQVIANGFVPMIMAIVYSITVNEIFLVGYVASLAEAFADTAASGLGVFSHTTFDVFKMKKVKAGLSGGMSVIGTVSSLVAAFVISLIAFAFGAVNVVYMLVAALAGFLGAFFDSFLGSVFQVKFKCPVCSEVVEKELHCGKKTEKYSGFYFFDNDTVNLLSGVFAAAVACAVCLII
jgi:uncharacterized protein (TIGR00297 family)